MAAEHVTRPSTALCPNAKVDVVRLTRELVVEKIDKIVEIARDVPGEYWGLEHFISERPRKFELSRLAMVGEDPVGYAIVSEREPGSIHLHHLMVRADYRSSGLGGQLLGGAVRLAEAAAARRFTLKVPQSSSAASRFYCAHGFAEEAVDGDYLWLAKDLGQQ